MDWKFQFSNNLIAPSDKLVPSLGYTGSIKSYLIASKCQDGDDLLVTMVVLPEDKSSGPSTHIRQFIVASSVLSFDRWGYLCTHTFSHTRAHFKNSKSSRKKKKAKWDLGAICQKLGTMIEFISQYYVFIWMQPYSIYPLLVSLLSIMSRFTCVL